MGKYKQIFVSPRSNKNRIELDPTTSVDRNPLPAYTYGAGANETFPGIFPTVRGVAGTRGPIEIHKEGMGVAGDVSTPTFSSTSGGKDSKEIDFFTVKDKINNVIKKHLGANGMDENKDYDNFLQKAWVWYSPRTGTNTPPPLPEEIRIKAKRAGYNITTKMGKQGAWYYNSQLRGGRGNKKGPSLLHGRKYAEAGLLETSFFESAKGDDVHGYHTLSGLGIPRSWSHCLVNSNPKAKIQVVGLDKYGRFQTIVDPKYIRLGVLNHFMTLQRMASHRRGEKITDAAKILGTLQKHSLSGSTAQRNAATIFLMEAQHGFRIGSYEKTLGSVKSFGTSTLLGKHITKTYTKMDKRGRKHYMVTFSFPGKNGHMHDEQVDSRAFYERVHAFKRRGGRDNDRIFQDPVRDGNGRKVYQPVTWKSVHRYMDSLTKKNSPNRIKTLAKPLEDGVINKYSGKKENQRYTSHDFRRYFATEMARKEIKNWIARNKGARPNSAEQYKALKDDVLGKVSKKLRNSPKVAESHYILETLWDRLQVPGVKDLKAQGVNAKKSMDDDGIDFWDSMSDMFDHTHLAGVDDYEDEEDEKEENKEENNKNEIPSESTDKGIEEIRERIGKMLQKDSEMAEQEDESLWNDAADDPKKIWECTRDSKLKEEKIGEAINVLDSKNLPASDWWCKIDGVGVITGRANQIQAVLDQNVTPSGVQI